MNPLRKHPKRARRLRLAAAVGLMLLMPATLLAQIGEHRSQLSVGAGAGATFSSVDFDPTIKQKQLVQPMVGLTLRYTCEKYFTTICALQVDLNLVKIGWEEEILNASSEPLPDTYSREISYVQLPLLARLGWGREERGLQFFVTAGPQFGYMLSNNSKRSQTWTLNTGGLPDRPNNVYQQYELEPQRSFDYGLAGGLGVELSTGIGHFQIEGRYYFGLNDVYNNSKKDPFARSAHRSILAKLTYMIDLKRTR